MGASPASSRPTDEVLDTDEMDPVESEDAATQPAPLIEEDEEREGYISDFISGKLVRDTPEERDAVQTFAMALVNDYGYPKSHIQTRPQYRVKAAPSDRKKEYPVDIAVFASPSKKESEAYIVVECKRKTRKDGRSQLRITYAFQPRSLASGSTVRDACSSLRLRRRSAKSRSKRFRTSRASVSALRTSAYSGARTSAPSRTSSRSSMQSAITSRPTPSASRVTKFSRSS